MSITVFDSCASKKEAEYKGKTELYIDEDDVIEEETVSVEYDVTYEEPSEENMSEEDWILFQNFLNSNRKDTFNIIIVSLTSSEIKYVIRYRPRETASINDKYYPSASREDIIDEQTSQSIEVPDLGTLVYDMDTAFYYDVIFRVKAKISSKYHVEITQEIVEEFNPIEEDLVDYVKRLKLNNIITSEVMDMKLDEITPNTFTIKRLSSNNQIIEEGWTTWEWSVLPLQPGKYNLRLRAIVKDENEHSNDLVVFDKEIDVKIQNKVSWYLELFNNSNKSIHNKKFKQTVKRLERGVWCAV